MIACKRIVIADAIAVLTKADRKGLTERDRMVGHVESGDPKKKPEYQHYRDPAVKSALNQIFHHKCAYCESRYEHVAPMDVEHYRPKSAVLGDDGKLEPPGYYWLGAEWTNLLPSCVSCNRIRTLEVWDPSRDLLTIASGKGNKFPIAPATRRARKPAQVTREHPLLLDPTRDDPARHLEFTDDGFVRPRNSKQEREAPKGAATIDVLGLSRAALVEERRSYAKPIFAIMKVIVRNRLRLRRDPADDLAQEDLAAAEKDLSSFYGRTEPHQAMARQLRRSFRAILRDVDRYWKATDHLARRGSPARVRAVEAAVVKLKVYLSDDRPDHNLAAQVLKWGRIVGEDGTPIFE